MRSEPDYISGMKADVSQMADGHEERVPYSTVLHGTVVGVNRHETGQVIHLKLADGGHRVLAAADDVVRAAVGRFGDKVRVSTSATWDGTKGADWVAESIEPWEDADLLDTLCELHDQLKAEGVSVDVDAWIRDLD